MKLPELGLGKAIIIAFLSLPASVASLCLGIILGLVISFSNPEIAYIVGMLGIYGMFFCWAVGIAAVVYSLVQKGYNAMNK